MGAKLNFSVALAALAATYGSGASAAEPTAAPSDWTGFYIGAGGGGNFLFVDSFQRQSGTSTSFNFSYDTGDQFSDLGKAGLFGTIQAGADYQMDRFVFGILANYDFGKTKVKSTGIAAGTSTFNGPSTDAFETSWTVGDSFSIGGRMGVTVHENALLYVLGGYTTAKVRERSEAYGDTFTSSGWEDGFFVGAGAEFMLTENLSLTGEYRYADYGKVKRSGSFTSFNSTSNYDHNGDVTVHSVRAVLNLRF